MATLDTLATRPSGDSHATGKAYFETSTNNFIVWNGSSWVELDSDGTGSGFQNRWGVNLDGTNDNIAVTPSSSIDLYGFSVWFKSNNVISKDSGVQGVLLGQGGSAYTLALGGNITGDFTNELITIRQGAQNSFAYTSASATIDTNWHHIVAAWSTSSATTGGDGYDIYLDGVKVGNASGTSTPSSPYTLTGSSTFTIGMRQSGSPSYSFNGLIDEASIFNSTLSSSDIATLWNSGVPADISSLGPVGWWRMGDDSNSATSGGPVASITDSSGNGNDATQATASSQPTFKALDQSTTSLSFDGSSDYLGLPDSAALETTAFTWSAWFYCTVIGRHNAIVDTSTDFSFFNGYHIRVNSTNKIRFASYSANDSIDSTTVVATNTWYHVAATHESGSDKLYVNGVLESTGSASNFSVSDAANLRIGSSLTFNMHHQGLIDEVSFFNTALTQSQITSLAASRGAHILNDLSLSPVAYYRMGEDDSLTDGASASQITDASGNGNHATQAVAADQPTASFDPIIYV